MRLQFGYPGLQILQQNVGIETWVQPTPIWWAELERRRVYIPEGFRGPAGPLGTSCGSPKDGAQEACGKKLRGTWTKSLEAWLALLLRTDIRKF